jgi:parallel beta-helix repeat protein
MLKSSLRKLMILPLVYMSAPCSTTEVENPSQSSSSQPPCNDRCQSSRISARHIENKGIGYNTGYTTLEAFLAAPTDLWSVMPFVDLRGHIFNDGHWAANGGLGLRSLLKDRIYGAYAYYDYRDTKRKGYNQVSFGVETLGTFWDLRLNGYVVIGSRQSRPYDTQFSQFAGNNIYYTQKFQYALSGGNAEVGFYPLKMQDVTLYTGIGPYYLKGPVGGAVWGGQARAKAMWKDYVGAEVSYSYDHTFKNIVQGQVLLSFPFGPKRKVRESKGRSCIDNYLLCQRMIEPVGKSEIIPVTTKKNKNLAINPATGQPYTVWFVNNLSHSAGTYESPFSTLAAAESASQANDLIYVYPGDLTSTGLSSGITVKNGQQLLGATINQVLMTTAGPIMLPAQAPGSNAPLLSNGAGAVVTLASNNVISGFYIQNTAGAGILASGSSNATLIQNYIQGNGTYNGIELDNIAGTVTVSSNTIMYQEACVNIDNSSPISNASYLFTNNTLHSEDGNYGFNIAFAEGSNNYFLSSNNNLYASELAGINISCSNTAANMPHVFDITNCNIGTYDNYAVKLVLNDESISQLNIQNSTINSEYGVYTITNNQSQLTSSITDNAFNVYEYAFEPETHSSSFTNATFTNNSITCYEYAIYIESLDSSTLAVNISKNTVSNYEYAFYTDLSDSANLTGTIGNNTLNSLYYGISTNTANSSNFAADINNNVINSAYYHIDISNNDSSAYSGNIIGNTFVGQDNDDTIYWNVNTSGTVSSIISNNLFTGNYGAIDLVKSGTGTATLEILNNTVQNSSYAGIGIANSGTNFRATVSGNTFQGFGTNAVNVSNTAGEMCLKLNNNTSNPYPNAYVIDVTGGTLNLVTPTANLGQLEATGTTPVSLCP